MSVSAESQRIGLTWEAFIELPEELLRHAELPGSGYVDCDERVVHVLHPNGEYREWVDGDVVVSPLLPGFEVAVVDLISQVS
jgi:hypothetical protein